jgi:prolyl 4-hydroxylase
MIEDLEQIATLIDGVEGTDGFWRGVERLEAASAAGGGDSTAMLAALEAAGAGRSQNWERAFELLNQAAAQGSARADAQLQLLGDQDVDRLLRFPGRVSLSDDPRIRSAPGFATTGECRWLIDSARGKLGRALTYDLATGAGTVDQGRSNSAVEFKLSQLDVVVQVVRTRIAAITKLPLPLFEPPQVLHYDVGQEFSPHYDFLETESTGQRDELARFGQRIATFLICLNNGFEGGETDFPAVPLRFHGSTGDALFFANVDESGAPDRRTLHSGLAPTSGEKWVFSQWIRDRSPAMTH